MNKESLSTRAMFSVHCLLLNRHWNNWKWFLTLLKPLLDSISTPTETV